MRKLPVGCDVGRVEALEARLFLNAGAPSLEVFQQTGPRIRIVQTADFDGDGDMDIAIHSSRPRRSVVTVLANNGHGEFERVATRRFPLLTIGFAVGDFNGDGVSEIAVGSRLDDGAGTLIRLLELDSDAGRLRRTESLILNERLRRFRSIPAGTQGDSLLMKAGSQGRILRVGDAGLQALEPAYSLTGSVSDPRIVDADGDGYHDIVVVTYQSMPSAVEVRIFHQDPSNPGTFTAASTVLAMPDIRGIPLVADVDQDGLPDIVAMATGGRVLFFKATVDGYETPELIYERPDDFPTFYLHNLVGSGVGPTGDFEIWVKQTRDFSGRPPTSPQTHLLRLVRQDDGSFSPRIAFSQGLFTDRRPTGRYQPAHLTNDSAMDFLAVTGLHGFRSNAIIALKFDGTDRMPLVRPVSVQTTGTGAPDTASTGDTVVLSSRVIDPEEMIGEPGGIRRVSYFLDVNGNGVIDEGDRRIARGPTSHFIRTVRAGWPRGTFNVLVQAADIHGNQSAVYCAAQQLTIV